MGRHGFPGIPRGFDMQLPLVEMVLREASALMRISSICIQWNLLTVTCEGRSPCIRRSVRKVPTEFSMRYIHIEHLYKQATCI